CDPVLRLRPSTHPCLLQQHLLLCAAGCGQAEYDVALWLHSKFLSPAMARLHGATITRLSVAAQSKGEPRQELVSLHVVPAAIQDAAPGSSRGSCQGFGALTAARTAAAGAVAAMSAAVLQQLQPLLAPEAPPPPAAPFTLTLWRRVMMQHS
ncbi:hypothetical protein COO60DRAFT_1672899, partial [Scenedesmus sp. NREL 46B-D3]